MCKIEKEKKVTKTSNRQDRAEASWNEKGFQTHTKIIIFLFIILLGKLDENESEKRTRQRTNVDSVW